MSVKAQRALNCLSKSMRDNYIEIEEKLRKAGADPNLALVYSAAKYFEALNKLAEE